MNGNLPDQKEKERENKGGKDQSVSPTQATDGLWVINGDT